MQEHYDEFFEVSDLLCLLTWVYPQITQHDVTWLLSVCQKVQHVIANMLNRESFISAVNIYAAPQRSLVEHFQSL